MNVRVEDEYFDVLQNIESAVVAVFEGQRGLSDREVLGAIEALIRVYESEDAGRPAGPVRLSERACAVYDQCQRMCEWRLGRETLNPGESDPPGAGVAELEVREIIVCLRRIRKSVRIWHGQGGPQGYLRYVSRFLDDANSGLGV